ncbi:tetratricopeptide repeat protein [Desulforhopalus sp. IMCC35007]|uniref:tetratricopeptide repeat protein n=1 Tax=Desulforhopalus sp. IMCC35007 TaxID=2569543 RepID=UPI00145F8C5F|nr:tetratricopeptide repeat protein [Desulforhopalus sp. IMCC35007]
MRNKTSGTLLAMVLLILVMVPFGVQATDLASRFEEGNAAYSRGDYDSAVEIFSEITSQNGNAASVLYNLANSYAQRGDTGLAILNYERALKISPNDPDILGNLAKVRKDRGLFATEAGKLERLFSIFSIDGWAILALCCLFVMILLLAISLKTRPGRRMFFTSWSCTLVILTLSVFATAYNYRSYNPLVVVAGGVKLQISPFEGATSAGAIEEGRLVFPIKSYNNYTYVQDGAGRKGWLKNDEALAVIQRTP